MSGRTPINPKYLRYSSGEVQEILESVGEMKEALEDKATDEEIRAIVDDYPVEIDDSGSV